MNGHRIQESLFQRIREKLPRSASLADAIAELLCVSSDSAYRRIRGETLLVLEEARILCEAFSISLDQLLHSSSDTIAFSSVQLSSGYQSFVQYLQGIHKALLSIDAHRSKQLIYLTKDVPLFYNFLFSPLFAFRYFFWMKSILQDPHFVSRKFSFSLLSPEIEALGSQISALYAGIPSIEIWNNECVNSTISQIEYYREAGYFNSEEEVSRLYASLYQLIEHIRAQSEAGCKFLPGQQAAVRQCNFECYYNRLVLGDNTIMVLLDGKKMLYLSYDVLNYITTQDEAFCNNVYAKLQNHIRKATVLSNTSEKQRNIFFNALLKKLPQRTAIKKLP